MMEINVSRRITAPASEVWRHIGDFSNIAKFHPLLKGSHFNSDTQSCEVGSSRQCDMKGGNYIKERIVDWNEGSHYSVDIYETSMPINQAKATFGVRVISENRSEVYMQFGIIPKYRILGPMMYVMFRYIVGPGILRGLEKYLMNNQPEIILSENPV